MPVSAEITTEEDKRLLLSRLYKTRISPEISNLANTLPQSQAYAIEKQFWPNVQELEFREGFSNDPLQEDDSDIQPLPNIVHKYPGKILYLTTEECPVYCRYCTRKRRTLVNANAPKASLIDIKLYIESKPAIQEIIFSGGDPFMLSDTELFSHVHFFSAIEQIKFIRFHTRTLTTLPKRFNQNFFHELSGVRKNYPHTLFSLVTHINTPWEIQEFTKELADNFRTAGIILYNQSVLLSGINDSAETLMNLSLKLIRTGIQPYYLHHLDKITGAGHFEVSLENGLKIMNTLKEMLPPFLVPRYVHDSKKGKQNLFY